MNVLAGLLLISLVVVVAALLGRRRRSTAFATPALRELIDSVAVAVRSLDGEMPDLRESFRVSAYMGLGGAFPWTSEVCTRLIERLEHVKMCLGRMGSNVSIFEQLGSLSWAYTMGRDQLALEIVTKAAGCKLALVHLQRRIRIYDLVPVSMWRLLGKRFASDVLYSGNDLIQQYQALVERVLVFARARAEGHPYDSLLAAL